MEPERAFVRNLGDPRLPTKEEVEQHRIRRHIPYRNWCPECVKAMGKEMGYYRDKGKVRDIPEYSWDYCFPGDELGYKWTVLLGKERKTGMIMSSAVPEKGGGHKVHDRQVL